ncbi:MAG: hypothetical protein LBI60_02965 [Bacteroidales bacterium]|jgi:hypothetical protein|nr:hypothetical protein [Bacteroidales bacterium]
MARIRRMGESYSSGDVTVTAGGMQDVNPSAIEYDYKYGHEYEMGLRRKPRAWRMGGIEYTCSITLPLDVVSEFEKVAPQGDLAKLRPFPINVFFFNNENEPIMDLIIAKFQGSGRKVNNDDAIEHEFELFVIDMDLNQKF